MKNIYLKKILEYKEIYNIYLNLGKVYDIPLNIRLNNFKNFIYKIYELGQTYAAYNNENCIIGVISFYANDYINRCAFITEIIVDKSNQSSGVGSSLLRICKEESKNLGMKYIGLEVKSSNINAMNFYVKNGFIHQYDITEKSKYMLYEIKDEKNYE